MVYIDSSTSLPNHQKGTIFKLNMEVLLRIFKAVACQNKALGCWFGH